MCRWTTWRRWAGIPIRNVTRFATARNVGSRYDSAPCVLKVDAGWAWQDGLLFYHGNETIWLADRIPPEYLERKE